MLGVCLDCYRGVGCIFYEMGCGRPLFPGSTVEDELHLIFKTLGTPSDVVYPGLSSNEEYLSYNIPNYSAEPLINIAPRYVEVTQACFRSCRIKVFEYIIAVTVIYMYFINSFSLTLKSGFSPYRSRR